MSVVPGGRSAADPAQAGRVPDGGKPWGWVVIETLLSPAELSTTGTAPRPSTMPQRRSWAPAGSGGRSPGAWWGSEWSQPALGTGLFR